MRASTFAAIALQFGALAFAQDLTTLPTCAQAAALQGVTASGCGAVASCLCTNDGFIASLKATISNSCTGSDQQAACDWGNSACASYGVSIDCSIYADAANSATSTIPAADIGSTSQMTMSSTGTSSMMTSSMGIGTESMATTSSMRTSMAGTESKMSSMISGIVMSMTTTTMLSGNETMSCTHGCRNHTLAATSMMSKTASGPTSLYTGAANSAARHCGVVEILAGVALVVALL